MSRNPVYQNEYFHQTKQLRLLEHEESRRIGNERLAVLKKNSVSCFSCSHYSPLNPTTSICKRSGNKVKFYNICESWKERN